MTDPPIEIPGSSEAAQFADAWERLWRYYVKGVDVYLQRGSRGLSLDADRRLITQGSMHGLAALCLLEELRRCVGEARPSQQAVRLDAIERIWFDVDYEALELRVAEHMREDEVLFEPDDLRRYSDEAARGSVQVSDAPTDEGNSTTVRIGEAWAETDKLLQQHFVNQQAKLVASLKEHAARIVLTALPHARMQWVETQAPDDKVWLMVGGEPAGVLCGLIWCWCPSYMHLPSVPVQHPPKTQPGPLPRSWGNNRNPDHPEPGDGVNDQ